MKISVVGAGPAGLFFSYLAAKKGYKVEVYEEHENYKKPCGGVVTKSIKNIDNIFTKLKGNEIKRYSFFSKNNTISLKMKNADIVLEREKFGKWLAGLAEEEGAKIFLKSRVEKFKKKGKEIFFNIGKKIKKTNLLIMANGVGKSKKILAMQVLARIKSEKEEAKIWLGSIAPGFFAWQIPLSEKISKIGIATNKKTPIYFEKFLKKINVKNTEIIRKEAAYIPIDKPKTSHGSLKLLGDAACHCKATTGGGIIPSLRAAKILASSLENGSYEENLELKKELMLHYKIRCFMNKFDDKKWDFLLKMSKTSKKILESINRDELSKTRIYKFLFPSFVWKKKSCLSK